MTEYKSSNAPSRTVINRADDLPLRSHRLDRLPSEYLTSPLKDLEQLAARLEADLLADLELYDIRDAATLSVRYTALATLAQLRGDWASVPRWTMQGRLLQEKAGARLTSGVLTDLMAQCRQEGHDGTWLSAEVRQRFGTMPWSDVADIAKSAKGSLETFSPDVLVGAFQSQFDPIARNGQGVVQESVALGIVSARLQMDMLGAFKAALVDGLQAVIDANRQETQADIWTPRTFAIAADADAAPVVIGVWDSGVDLALFSAAPGGGIAFDDDGQPAQDLLRPLGEAAARWPQTARLLKGTFDQRAALDTEEARQYRAELSGLKAQEVKSFLEDMSLAGVYVHGTHVAGIAVEGNPFASVFTATMLLSHEIEPKVPTEARSRQIAAAYAATVDALKRAGARVVNMSWGAGPRMYEDALAFHNVGATLGVRREEALRLFNIESDALEAAIAHASDILFVAAAGNGDNDADFQRYIPAGYSLPNLITVGAVDRAGAETSFSTFGKTVVVHANGFEVDSFLPGGQRMKLSGTSMASPQVANLAAKLFALRPALTAVEVKELILQGAERIEIGEGQYGRVNLVNPRRSAELAGFPVYP